MALPPDPLVRSLLNDSFVAQVATLSARRRPFMTPLWFVADCGALYLTTGGASWAARNVAQQGELAILLYGERAARRGSAVLRLRGAATFHPGLPPWRALARFAAKYYLAPGALRAELRHARQWGLRRQYYRQSPDRGGYIRCVPAAAEFLLPP